MPERESVWRGFRAFPTAGRDGDTIRVMTDGGFESRAEPRLRLYDVSAPELAVRLPAQAQPGGRETTEFVDAWLAAAHAKNPRRRWWLWVDTLLTRTYEPEQRRTFVRYVARVWQYDEHEAGLGEPATLNSAIRLFLSGHPEWPSGD
jgi:endonuclease YncB( thermonuclease family)